MDAPCEIRRNGSGGRFRYSGVGDERDGAPVQRDLVDRLPAEPFAAAPEVAARGGEPTVPHSERRVELDDVLRIERLPRPRREPDAQTPRWLLAELNGDADAPTRRVSRHRRDVVRPRSGGRMKPRPGRVGDGIVERVGDRNAFELGEGSS